MIDILVHVSDLHSNSSVALMPPQIKKDNGQIVHASRTQKWIWGKWLDFWDKTARFKKETGGVVTGIINGDWGDINIHSGFELIEGMNPDVVLNIMVETVQPMVRVCDRIFVIRGTEAHTGGSGWLENRAAREIGAEKNYNERPENGDEDYTWSWYIWEGELNGVKITSSHHPGTNSTRPWTMGNEANRRAAMDVYNYTGVGWMPDVTLWGHFHHNADSGDTHKVRAIYNRSWQAKTSFSYRIGMANNQSEIGGLWVFCADGKYKVLKQEYKLPRPKVWKQS